MATVLFVVVSTTAVSTSSLSSLHVFLLPFPPFPLLLSFPPFPLLLSLPPFPLLLASLSVFLLPFPLFPPFPQEGMDDGMEDWEGMMD